MTRSRAQVLVFYALVLPLVLLPVAAYAVDAAAITARHAALQAATAEVAEIAAQRIDVDAIRATGSLQVDPRDVQAAVASALAGEEPSASLDAVTVKGSMVTVATSESVSLPLPVLSRAVVVRARAAARIVPGYDNPSSLLPFWNRTF